MSCVPGMPCYQNTERPNFCKNYPVDSNLVIYSGPNLPNSGVNTKDCLTLALSKIDNTLNGDHLAQLIIAAISQSPTLQVGFCNLVNDCQ